MSDNYFEFGLEHGGVAIHCHCGAGTLDDVQSWDGDPDSPTFGMTPLRVHAFHDVAVVADVEEHPGRRELSRPQMIFWGPRGCSHSMHLSTEAARRLAHQLIESADEVDRLRNENR